MIDLAKECAQNEIAVHGSSALAHSFSNHSSRERLGDEDKDSAMAVLGSASDCPFVCWSWVETDFILPALQAVQDAENLTRVPCDCNVLTTGMTMM